MPTDCPILTAALPGVVGNEAASCLASMARADKNIDGPLVSFQCFCNRSKQSIVDEEPFDVISGYEAMLSSLS